MPGYAPVRSGEAAGSRGLPVKAPLAHEPAVPPEAGLTVVLAGASGFGRPVREAVHRPERFCALAPVRSVGCFYLFRNCYRIVFSKMQRGYIGL